MLRKEGIKTLYSQCGTKKNGDHTRPPVLHPLAAANRSSNGMDAIKAHMKNIVEQKAKPHGRNMFEASFR